MNREEEMGVGGEKSLMVKTEGDRENKAKRKITRTVLSKKSNKTLRQVLKF